jgi:hypothetical protein
MRHCLATNRVPLTRQSQANFSLTSKLAVWKTPCVNRSCSLLELAVHRVHMAVAANSSVFCDVTLCSSGTAGRY